jgi:N-dimethylarginine dimethylaminohydrolase
MKIDYSNEIKKINNQKNTSSCTSNALSTILSFIIYRQGCYFFPISILYIYYNTRYLQGDIFKDDGSVPIIALEAIEKFGICPEYLWPLDQKNLMKEPDSICFEFAQKYPFQIIYESFQISNQSCWISTFLKHLLNGNLLLCAMKRDEIQEFPNEIGIVSDVNRINIWYHSIVCIGIDEETQIVLFCNSHGTDTYQSGLFSMTFDQIYNLNPIDDLVYVIDGIFKNDRHICPLLFSAVLPYYNNIELPPLTSLININNDNICDHNVIYDHLIIGSGITGRYLAYQLQKRYPNDLILLIDNSFKSQYKNSLIYLDYYFDELIASNALNYSSEYLGLINDLFNEFDINLEDEDFYWIYESLDHNLIENFIFDLKPFFEKYGINIFNTKNKFINLYRLFLNNDISRQRGTSLFSFANITLEEYNKNYDRRILGNIQNYPLFFLIKNIYNNYIQNKNKLRENFNIMFNNLIKNFKKIGFGNFFDNDSNDNFYVTQVFAEIENKNTVLLYKTSIESSYIKLSSPYRVYSKNIYHTNLTFNPNNIIFNYFKYNEQNIYLIFKDTIPHFKPYRNKWGTLLYYDKYVINFRDIENQFFYEISNKIPIPFKNGMEYNLNDFPKLNEFISNNIIQNVHSIIIFNYPNSIGCIDALYDPESNFLKILNNELNFYSSIHNMNTNFNILSCEIEGSLWMVEYFLTRNELNIGYIVSEDWDNKEFIIDLNIPNSNKLFINYKNNIDEIIDFVDQTDIIYFQGSINYGLELLQNDLNILSQLLKIIEIKNSNGLKKSLILSCHSFELLIFLIENDINVFTYFNDIHTGYEKLFPYENGQFSNLKNIYMNHNIGIQLNSLSNILNEYKITSYYEYNNVKYIAILEHKLFPIFAFQGHLYDHNQILIHNYFKQLFFKDKFNHIQNNEIYLYEYPIINGNNDGHIQFQNLTKLLQKAYKKVITISYENLINMEMIYIKEAGFFIDEYNFIISKTGITRRNQEWKFYSQYFKNKNINIIYLKNNFFEGSGDAIYSWDKQYLFLSYGIRTTLNCIHEILGYIPNNIQPIILKKTNPKYFHLDLCLNCVFDKIFFIEEAFDQNSIDKLYNIPNKIPIVFPFTDNLYALNFIYTFEYIFISESVSSEICEFFINHTNLKIMKIPFYEAEKNFGSISCCTLIRSNNNKII